MTAISGLDLDIDRRAFQQRLERLDTLLRAVEQKADPRVHDQLREIVQAVLDLHADGLRAILRRLDSSGEAGAAILADCAHDEVIGGLLLLHGLHPLTIEDRVLRALEQVRPYLRSHGGNVELLGVAGGVVRLRLEGNCQGCPSSALTMKQTVEEAILGHAPDVRAVEVEGAMDDPGRTPDGLPLVVLPTMSH
jgi:Fe-S cluster biogenesis protein NfuA